MKRDRIIARFNLQSLFQVSFSSGKIISDSAQRRAQTQIFHLLCGVHLQFCQGIKTKPHLLLGCGLILQIAVRVHQLETQLCGIQNAFGWTFRHGGDCSQIFTYSVRITMLHAGEVPANGMQAVVVGIKLLAASKIHAGLIQIAEPQLRLCGGQLHTHGFGSHIRRLLIGVRGLAFIPARL